MLKFTAWTCIVSMALLFVDAGCPINGNVPECCGPEAGSQWDSCECTMTPHATMSGQEVLCASCAPDNDPSLCCSGSQGGSVKRSLGTHRYRRHMVVADGVNASLVNLVHEVEECRSKCIEGRIAHANIYHITKDLMKQCSQAIYFGEGAIQDACARYIENEVMTTQPKCCHTCIYKPFLGARHTYPPKGGWPHFFGRRSLKEEV